MNECHWSPDAAECAMMRERQVAGTPDRIPACPVHGEHPEYAAPTECDHAVNNPHCPHYD